MIDRVDIGTYNTHLLNIKNWELSHSRMTHNKVLCQTVKMPQKWLFLFFRDTSEALVEWKRFCYMS